MKTAVKVAKGSLQFTTGIGLSILFISTMDDFVYGDFKRNVIMPMHMINIKSQGSGYSMDDAKVMAEGAGKFAAKFKPMGVVSAGDARELLLKDAEYSTPQDHYFAHIQTKKQLEMERDLAYESIKEAKELQIMRHMYDTE